MKILIHVKQIEILENYETEDNSGSLSQIRTIQNKMMFQERGRRSKTRSQRKGRMNLNY
jgi:hypothetical protein